MKPCPFKPVSGTGLRSRLPRSFGRLLATTVSLVLILPVVSSTALTVISTNLFSQAPEATLSDETWVACLEADLAGSAHDDLYILAAGGALSGEFGGDIWMAARDTILFSGHAADQVRLLASRVECNGSVNKSLMAVGHSVTLSTGSVVQSDCVLVGTTVDYKGFAARDLYVAGNSVTIQGHIKGNLYVAGPDISIMPNTVIGGNLYYAAEEDLVLARQVQLGGVVERKAFPFLPRAPTSTQLALQTLRQFVGSIVLGLLVLWFFPKTTGRAVRILRHRPPLCLLLGSALLLFLPFLAALTLASSWLRPCYLAATTLCGMLVLVGRIVTAIIVGSLLLRRRGPQPFRDVLVALAVGLLVLYLAAFAPIVNWTVWLATTAFGCGALLHALIQGEKETVTPPIPSPRPQAEEPDGQTQM